MAGNTFSPTLEKTSFYTGSSVTTLAPGYMPIALAGHLYQIDPAKFKRDSVPVLRQQADQSAEPGESSTSPKGQWKRSQENWNHGAGQVYFDQKYVALISQVTSSRDRFRRSKGVDPWTQGILKLLPDTTLKRSSANTNLAMVVAGAYLYLADGTEVYWSTDGTNFTAAGIAAGGSSVTVQSIATNGYHVWAALGANGIHRTTRGATTSTATVPAGTFTGVWYAQGRLLAANGNVLYEITSPLGTPVATALRTHDNSDFVWDNVSPGRNVIYASGSSGGTSELYRINLEAATTGLGVPTSATYFPDGEQLYAMQYYAGAMVLATNQGVRIATADGAGNLDYGPLVPIYSPATGTTGVAIRCLEPQASYVWFGWTNYDGVSTGLGRLNLAAFVDTLVPSYASDLMATAQGAVLSVVTFLGARYFAVSALGVYGESTNKVASGTIETGAIRYGTTDTKLSRSVDLRHHSLPAGAAVGVEVKADEGSWVVLANSSTVNTAGPASPISTLSTNGETLELRFTLTRATVTTLGPELVRWTLRALPNPPTIEEQIQLPILMATYVDSMAGDGQPVFQDVTAEIAFLKALELSGQVVSLQVGNDVFTVYVDECHLEGQRFNAIVPGDRAYIEGLFTCICQTVP